MKNLYFSSYRNKSLFADFYTLFARGFDTDKYLNKRMRGAVSHRSPAEKFLNMTRLMKV